MSEHGSRFKRVGGIVLAVAVLAGGFAARVAGAAPAGDTNTVLIAGIPHVQQKDMGAFKKKWEKFVLALTFP